jgi:hypothetical protein
MYAEAHAAAGIKSAPDAATDDILDGAFAGWDARVYISEPGVDPFEGADDLDLLHAHAGVLAAIVMAQANQMRVLDSAIVPDRDLVRPTADPANKFNELEVYTPLTAPERYAVITEDGVEEVVTPSSPFYPGLSNRPAGSQTAIQLQLEDEVTDPYAIGMATATALLQIGIEAGRDVGPVADILNAAWGLDAGFSPGTVVGMAGTHDYAAIFAQDRNTNARRLASWQECSYVRSGQLSMETTDWGPHLHCDFRRIRVAAESMFATSMAAETRIGGKKPTGKIVYHVPATSLLSANPEYLFFADAAPELMPAQERCPAAEALLSQADHVGVLRALWPSAEPEIAETWAATFHSSGGLARTPVEFLPRTMTSAPLFAAATSRISGVGRSLATGLGRTVMTTLSARLAAMAENVVDVQTVGWLARFAAVIETMRLSTSRDERVQMVRLAWQSLAGNVPRDIERSMSTSHMRELKAGLPKTLSARLKDRSSKIPVFAVLLEVGNPKTSVSHTVLRGLRRGFARAAQVATAVTIREKVGWKAGHPAEWLRPRLAVVREFWAVQFAALGQVAHVAAPLRSDLKWWVEVSAAVNLFRAGVMRGFAVADEGDAVVAVAGPVHLRLRPYHAAAHLRKTLEPYFATGMPVFSAGERIAHWAYTLTTVTAPYVTREAKNLPRVARVGAASDHTSHFARGAFLLATEGALSDWVDSTLELVVSDCEALLEQRAHVAQVVGGSGAAQQTDLIAAALAKAAEDIAHEIGKMQAAVPPTPLFEEIEAEVPEDAWDSFVEAAWDTTEPLHAAAVRQLEAAKQCTDEAAAQSIARWIKATFTEAVEDSLATIE